MTEEKKPQQEPDAVGSELSGGLGRCRTCKFWKRVASDFDKSYHGEHAGECGNEKFVYEDKVSTDGLRYWDYEGYSAGFETGEDFGCIHHQTA